jgi:hypothetical protein
MINTAFNPQRSDDAGNGILTMGYPRAWWWYFWLSARARRQLFYTTAKEIECTLDVPPPLFFGVLEFLRHVGLLDFNRAPSGKVRIRIHDAGSVKR